MPKLLHARPPLDGAEERHVLKLEGSRHGKLEADDERGPARWTLGALAEAARRYGIAVERSQVRRIFLAAGARWRETWSWTVSRDPDVGPKGLRSSPSTPPRSLGRRPSASMSLVH